MTVPAVKITSTTEKNKMEKKKGRKARREDEGRNELRCIRCELVLFVGGIDGSMNLQPAFLIGAADGSRRGLRLP